MIWKNARRATLHDFVSCIVHRASCVVHRRVRKPLGVRGWEGCRDGGQGMRGNVATSRIDCE